MTKNNQGALEWLEVEKVNSLSPEELDALPVGVIQLDADGVILTYNTTESAISGRRAEDVIGKNFFLEVAPCTNVKEFAGRFREGVAQRDLSCVFRYLFDFRMQPTRVWVRMYFSEKSNSAWVFVMKDEDLS